MSRDKAIFQSTRPMRGATVQMLQDVLANEISIHAPRAGRDKAFPQWLNRHQEFQSTRPVRGAT